MTEEKYSSLASKALFLAFIIGSVFTIPYEIADGIGFALLQGGLAVSGVIAMVFALIAVLKKYITKKMYLPIGAFGFMVVWGIASLANSFDFNMAFYGTDGRGEGLLALIFYFCMFVTAMTIKGKKPHQTLVDGVVATGIINAIWAFLQFCNKGFPCNYRAVPMTTLEKNADGVLAPLNVPIKAVSGLAYSPISLAMLLGLSIIAALLGAVLCENKVRRIIYGASSAVMSFILVFTYSLVGWVGLGSAVIISLVVIFVKKAPKIRLIPILAAVAAPALSIAIIVNGVGGIYSNYELHDGPIMWHDSWFRLDSSGDYRTPEVKKDLSKLDDTKYAYGYMNDKTISIIKRYPLLGTGPENLIFAQVYENYKLPNGDYKISGEAGVLNEGTFDKCYNEFLYIAATRGIPSLIAFLVLLVTSVAFSVKKLKSQKDGKALIFGLCVVISGIIMFTVGTSSMIFAPIFWTFAGVCVGGEEKK